MAHIGELLLIVGVEGIELTVMDAVATELAHPLNEETTEYTPEDKTVVAKVGF